MHVWIKVESLLGLKRLIRSHLSLFNNLNRVARSQKLFTNSILYTAHEIKINLEISKFHMFGVINARK